MTIKRIQEVVRSLIVELGPEIKVVRVYAYGSQVRGDADTGSDLDLLIELWQVTRIAKRRIRDVAWELSLKEGYVISVIIVSQQEFEGGPLASSEFVQNIRRDGIEIAA